MSKPGPAPICESMKVSNEKRTEWGSAFEDRSSSFDDRDDLYRLIEMTREYESLQTYFTKFFSIKDLCWRLHPNGQYDVDASLFSAGNDISVANFDIERWMNWDKEWPSYYTGVNFLARKGKFLSRNKPFFMTYLNKSRDKLLIVEEKIILRHPIQEQRIKKDGVIDRVRKIPTVEVNIFGNITENERQRFIT